MDAAWLLAGAATLATARGLCESFKHRGNLARIPIRVHVNGTRGKTGVTRLIAAGLREGGVRTCAKTTGTLARMILPDGSEYPVFRPSRPNVLEQLRIVRAAVAHRAEALVIECMALQPELQSLCELKLVRATHGVITNARADHLDVMGPTDRDVARALAGTVPVGGTLFTAERVHLDIFREAARDRGSRLIGVGPDDAAGISSDELSRFSYVEHAENVALALRVCLALGVDRETALRGMVRATPDPGVMSVHELDLFQGTVLFVNGFAANDPDSTERIWRLALERFPRQRRIAVFNCRADRADRSIQLAKACPQWPAADHYLLIGSGTELFAHKAVVAGLDPRAITRVEGQSVGDIVETIFCLANGSTLVMGMGNIGGPGMGLVRYFTEHGTAPRKVAELVAC